ncbi:hypothetical protein BDW62DRAFT_202143 [Aspergillus aurantiobrunneus]
MRATFAVLASLLAVSATATASPVQTRQIDSVSITFYNAQGDTWEQVFPTDMSSSEIGNDMTVSRIYNPGGAICTFSGTEGGFWTVHIGETTLDNPQPLRSGTCGDL